MLGLYIGGGVVGYFIGIFLCSYLYGRFNPMDYSMEEPAMWAIGFWPVVALLAIPIGLIALIGTGIGKAGHFFREKGAAPGRARIEAERNQRDLERRINNIEFFDGEGTNNSVPVNFVSGSGETFF